MQRQTLAGTGASSSHGLKVGILMLRQIFWCKLPLSHNQLSRLDASYVGAEGRCAATVQQYQRPLCPGNCGQATGWV